MSKELTDNLLDLIKSLSKSEKRNFKLYAQRNSSGKLKFLELFDVLDRTKIYNEKTILKQIPSIKKSQLSNLKSNLYKQILKSLRLSYVSADERATLRESIDFSRVLFNKGLYSQSLKILEKAKISARAHNLHLLLAEIIDFEKTIESRYVTKSLENRAEQLAIESKSNLATINKVEELSNLALRLYGLYIKVGYIRSKKDAEIVKQFFQVNLPKHSEANLGLVEKLYLYQSYSWYYYIMQDFVRYYKYAKKWVELFENKPDQHIEIDVYVKGVNNLMSSQFNTFQSKNLEATLARFNQFTATISRLDSNLEMQIFYYKVINSINLYFIKGEFSRGCEMIPSIEKDLANYIDKFDKNRLTIIYYKIACLYFGSGDNKNAIKYLNKIINESPQEIREDINGFARILNLIAHYELENTDLLEYQIKSVYRYLKKSNELHKVHQEILRFLRNLSHIRPDSLNREFKILKSKLVKLREEPFELRPFLYLDITSWLDSKLSNQTVESVIQQNYLKLKR